MTTPWSLPSPWPKSSFPGKIQSGNASVLSFAVLGLVLAAVGLYGLLSYLVTERTNEIGIRMALGAQRVEVLRIMFWDGLRPTVVGSALGLIGGGICAQLIRSFLFGVAPLDWEIFGAVALVMQAIAVAACTYPAWRTALRIGIVPAGPRGWRPFQTNFPRKNCGGACRERQNGSDYPVTAPMPGNWPPDPQLALTYRMQ